MFNSQTQFQASHFSLREDHLSTSSTGFHFASDYVMDMTKIALTYM